MTFAERFGRNLVRERRAAGLSQEQLGTLAELHRTAVGQLERGERVARTDTLVKLASSLEISPERLLGGLVFRPRPIVYGHMEVDDSVSE